MKMLKRKRVKLPNGSRYVKQDGYKRNAYSWNWCIIGQNGKMLSTGMTKSIARESFLTLSNNWFPIDLYNL